MGVQKGSLYAHIESKQDLLWEIASSGAAAFHEALDEVPERVPAVERIRLALQAHLRVVAEQLDVATVFTREWRYLSDERREAFVAERRRYEAADPRRSSARAASRASCAPTSTRARRRCSSSRPPTGRTRGSRQGRDTAELADRFFRLLVDGMRGYSHPLGRVCEQCVPPNTLEAALRRPRSPDSSTRLPASLLTTSSAPRHEHVPPTLPAFRTGRSRR